MELVEISEGKFLYIGTEVNEKQKQKLLSMVQEQSRAFAWDYLDMKGVHLDICIHHIYSNEDMRPI